jgi:uncharacterized membrane protein
LGGKVQESCRPGNGIVIATRERREEGERRMRSRAALGRHPIHPILVTVPIGAFVCAMAGDVLFVIKQQPQWFELSRLAIGVGLVAAPLAAIAGLVDYLGLPLRPPARRTASFHLGCNVAALLFYAISLVLRWQQPPYTAAGWGWAMTLSTLGLVVLGAAGWLGGKLVFEHRVGVVEDAAAAARS